MPTAWYRVQHVTEVNSFWPFKLWLDAMITSRSMELNNKQETMWYTSLAWSSEYSRRVWLRKIELLIILVPPFEVLWHDNGLVLNVFSQRYTSWRSRWECMRLHHSVMQSLPATSQQQQLSSLLQPASMTRTVSLVSKSHLELPLHRGKMIKVKW